jgi:hypothetical protein
MAPSNIKEIGQAIKEALVSVHSQGRISCPELRSRQADRAIRLLKREGILRESRFGYYALTSELAGKSLEDLLSTCKGQIKRSFVSLLLLLYWQIRDFV